MTPQIITLGELLVEIMREKRDVPHDALGEVYLGPYPSGAPAIFIDSAARVSKHFNFTTGFIGVIGDDAFGRSILHKLQRDQVDVSQIKVIEDATTGIAFNQYNSDGSRKFIFAAGAAGKTSPAMIKKEFFTDVKALHIMGSSLSISESSRDACYKAIEIARMINPETLISFDPNLRPEMLGIEVIIKICKPVLNKTDILLPSGEEAEMLTGIKGDIDSCIKLLEMGPKIVILKQGERGCTIFNKDNLEGIHVPSYSVQEIDPTGAGDTFGGAFISCYLAGWDLVRSARFANAAGALKVESFGPMPETTFEQISHLIEQN